MNWVAIRAFVFRWVAPAFVCGLCLFGACPELLSVRGVAALAQETRLVFCDPELQWMFVVCLAVYLTTFLILSRRLSGNKPLHPARAEFWLVLLLLFGGIRYASDYGTANRSTAALLLFFGAVFGLAADLWAGWVGRSGARQQSFVLVLIGLLVIGAFWQPESNQIFHYRGQARWSGGWENPNTFGVLMATGVVIAAGLVVSLVTRHVSRFSEPKVAGAESKVQGLKSKVIQWMEIVFLISAGMVCGIGLVKSYCRGAWLGAVFGVAYLAWKGIAHLTPALSPRPTGGEGESSAGLSASLLAGRSSGSWCKRNWLPIAAILVSLLILGFWSLRQTENLLVRRALSFGNRSDFSWRNRVSAWEGALQMMAEKPWLGIGWERTEVIYDQLYRAERVDESMAIQLNEFLSLGTSLGIPALACFSIFIATSISPKSNVQSPKSYAVPTLDFSHWTFDLPVICRAGALVLLVGFWFDGGLFKLALGPLFWMLLALGKEARETA